MRPLEAIRSHGLRGIAELAIVILGVSVAFSVESLKDHSDARQEEWRYLVELQADFRQNTTLLERTLASERLGESAAIALLGAIHQPGGSVEPDSVRAWFLSSLFSGGSPSLAQGTFAGLIQTGSLGLVEDSRLRSALAAFSSQLARDLEAMRYWDDIAFRDLVTDPYFQREVGVFELYSDELKEQRGLPLSNRFPVDFGRLVTEKEFGALAEDAYLMRRNRRLAVARLLGSSQAILDELDRVIAEGT